MRSLFKFFLRLACCSSGTALIEMTLIVPVAIGLMAGGVDFGMGYSTQATMGKSVRDAARFLGSLSAATACLPDAITDAKNLAVYGNLTGTGSALLPGWSVSNVMITTDQPGNSCPEPTSDTSPFTITVTATYNYQSIILAGAMAGYFPAFGTFALSATHEEPQVGGQ